MRYETAPFIKNIGKKLNNMHQNDHSKQDHDVIFHKFIECGFTDSLRVLLFRLFFNFLIHEVTFKF